MAYYLLRAKYAQDSMNALVQRPEDRMLTTTRLLKEVGGRLHYYFFCFGEYDIVLLFELPDNVGAASLAMTLSAAGPSPRPRPFHCSRWRKRSLR